MALEISTCGKERSWTLFWNRVLMLLSSLPDEFEHLETTLLHGKENVSLDVVYSALYSHELRKQDKMKTKSTTSEEALVARGRQQS